MIKVGDDVLLGTSYRGNDTNRVEFIRHKKRPGVILIDDEDSERVLLLGPELLRAVAFAVRAGVLQPEELVMAATGNLPDPT